MIVLTVDEPGIQVFIDDKPIVDIVIVEGESSVRLSVQPHCTGEMITNAYDKSGNLIGRNNTSVTDGSDISITLPRSK